MRAFHLLALGLIVGSLAWSGCGSSGGTTSADAALDAASEHAGDDQRRGDADGPSCVGDATIHCAQGARNGDIGVCSDLPTAPACEGGQWKCPAGTIDTTQCTCSGAPAPGCNTCTAHGWSCDAGAPDAPGDATTAHDAGTAVDAACGGCTRSTSGSYCFGSDVQWECHGAFDSDLFSSACLDPGTDIQRFCCPSAFQATCH